MTFHNNRTSNVTKITIDRFLFAHSFPLKYNNLFDVSLSFFSTILYWSTIPFLFRYVFHRVYCWFTHSNINQIDLYNRAYYIYTFLTLSILQRWYPSSFRWHWIAFPNKFSIWIFQKAVLAHVFSFSMHLLLFCPSFSSFCSSMSHSLVLLRSSLSIVIVFFLSLRLTLEFLSTVRASLSRRTGSLIFFHLISKIVLGEIRSNVLHFSLFLYQTPFPSSWKPKIHNSWNDLQDRVLSQ